MPSDLVFFSSAENETMSLGAVSVEDVVLGPRYASTLRISLIGVMLVLSLVGNLLVCYRLLTSRRHRLLKAQVLFLNLALADLLVTLITMNSQLLWEIMGRVWIAGDAPCRVFKVLQTYALVSSTYMLVGIAVDRHFAICNPLAPAPKPRSVAAACWLLSLVPSVPNLFVFRLVVVRDKYYCASFFYIYHDSAAARQAYMAFVFAFVFILPLVALVALYTSILLRMWKIDSASSSPRPPEALVGGAFDGSCCVVDGARSTMPKARLRTLKMAVVIFVAFLVTNLPYMVQEMLLAFAENVQLGPNLVAVFGVISALNSAVNPYVYLAFNGGAGVAWCDAHVCGLWRRLTCSSTSKRTVTVTYRGPWSAGQSRRRRRPLTAKAPPPAPEMCESCERQRQIEEKH
ncbi:oxytocin receptor-like [Dermacentor albipictus]|uniref:oxytocin receptor-like n=1 Tax=Dermacentor albipictus TaxID=60249 RepID=UPI0031FDDB3F